MRNQILPRRVNVPPVRPRPQRQRDLLPHETPRQVRIERHVDQKFRTREEEPRGNIRNLGRRLLLPPTHVPRVNPEYSVLHVAVREDARTKPRPLRAALVRRILLAEPRGISAQHRFGVVLRQLHLLGVESIPLLGEPQVRVRLQKVRLSPPQLAGEVPRGGGPVALRLVHVEGADLAPLAVFGVVGIGAELLDSVDVGAAIGYLRYGVAVLVLPLDFHAGATLDVDAEAILNHGANEQLVGVGGGFERLAESFPQEVIAVGPQRHEDGSVLPDGEYRSIAVGLLEGFEVVHDQRKVLFDDLVGSFGVLVINQHLVQILQEPLEDGDDARNRGFVVLEGIRDNFLSKQFLRHGARRHRREEGVEVRRLFSIQGQVRALDISPLLLRPFFLPPLLLRIVPANRILEILHEIHVSRHCALPLQRSLHPIQLLVRPVNERIQRIPLGQIKHLIELLQLPIVHSLHLADGFDQSIRSIAHPFLRILHQRRTGPSRRHLLEVNLIVHAPRAAYV
mmetsp:Transcript_14184/g.30317  ORF Transcript_14184/g.30317 Transcript_14184/m.30317 type:complete len:509 (+) Transcript_14184:380-1906(+)